MHLTRRVVELPTGSFIPWSFSVLYCQSGTSLAGAVPMQPVLVATCSEEIDDGIVNTSSTNTVYLGLFFFLCGNVLESGQNKKCFCRYLRFLNVSCFFASDIYHSLEY